VALVALGAAGLLFGGGAATIGLGALALFVGVIVGGPIIAVFGGRIFRPVMSLFGLEGRLAADNTVRNPTRTATTANALLIGVFLVTLVSVAGTSVKDFVVGEIKKLESADYIVQSTGGTIDSGLVDDFETIDGVEVVVPFRRESVTLDGEASLLSTGDVDAIQEIADIGSSEGSFADLGPGTVAVIGGGDPEPALGSTVTIADSAGDSVDLDVVAVIEPSIDTSQTGSFVDEETFDSLVGDTAPTVAFLDVTSGAQSDTKEAIEDRAALRPDIDVVEGNALGRLVGTIFDFLINAVNGLLLMSVIIAVIGIVNTLSLSILERRRELGLLRAVGMTDRRVQRMVRLESMLIAALGTIVGLALGIFVAWGLIRSIDRLADANIAFSLPGTRIVLVLVLGVALGVIASLIPARRSTKLDVLDAIQST
jgi:putative ABC transport system permease protein